MSVFAGEILLLTGAGLLAGAMNAVAGGGSFVSLPALIQAGLPSTIANASSTIGLFPGSLTSLLGFRGARFEPPAGSSPMALGVLSVVGGAIGAILLLVTDPAVFDRLVPWLLLVASVALVFGRSPSGKFRLKRRGFVLYPMQFALGIYGGYFGGAVGLMMMATWLLISGDDLKTMTPIRVVMVTLANTVAVLVFLIAGAWRWPETLALLSGALVGGWFGAKLSTRLPVEAVGWTVRTLAIVVTAGFFWRAYR